jgi:hypothetical protein
MKHNLLIGSLASLAIAGSANAGIVVHGSTTAYQESNKDWLTAGTNDIDGSGGLGTDGFLFFGDGSADTNQETGQAFGTDVRSTPTYVSGFAAGANFNSIADDVFGYGIYDDPIALDGTDARGGIAVATGGTAGTNLEIVTFTISGLDAGVTVRVGVLSNVDNQSNGRWDPTSITLSDGVNSATVGDHATSPLPNAPGQTDWVFFDIDADGTYAVSGTKRLNTQGAHIAGLTFDSVPEPSSLALLGLGGLMMVKRRQRD